MINFTVGPVMSEDFILDMGRKQVPYFRTPEFSEIMKKSEKNMIKLAKADEESRAVFITGSGTASMEATVMNCLTKDDSVLVVNGGSFGSRFVQMLELHEIPHTVIKLEAGHTLTEADLAPYDLANDTTTNTLVNRFTAFVVNIHETSTGVYYDPMLISDFCKRNGLFLIVDAISSFLADDFCMKDWGVNVMITGSQKALAVPPGVSIIVLDPIALKRVEAGKSPCMYLDLKDALKNGERGQTPFTPAVGILLQINARLNSIVRRGGAESETAKIREIAEDFRESIKRENLPLEIFSDNMSNAVTTVKVAEGKDAYKVFETLKEEYGIWVCPNGGDLAHVIFRVGHIGAITKEHNKILIEALKKLKEREII